jgi:TonB family protein
MDAVSQILVDRSQDADKVTRMVIASLAMHAALITAVAFVPSKWDVRPDPSKVMVISLGGAPGPVQGRNPMSPKPVQEAVPENVKPKNDAPPALARPEMVLPTKAAPVPPKAQVKPEPPKDTPQLRGRTPTQGAEVKSGTAKVETGSQSQTKFGGLATGGGGAGAAYTDYADFCCPEYLDQMVSLVRRNWQEKQGQDGTVRIKFTIQRDGTLTNIEVEKPAAPMLNIAAQRAIVNTRQLPPLPAAFTGDRLTVHLNMAFIR